MLAVLSRNRSFIYRDGLGLIGSCIGGFFIGMLGYFISLGIVGILFSIIVCILFFFDGIVVWRSYRVVKLGRGRSFRIFILVFVE